MYIPPSKGLVRHVVECTLECISVIAYHKGGIEITGIMSY